MSKNGEYTAVANTKTPNTAEGILAGLRALGVREGDTFIVHSSMSSLGWVCGEEQAVTAALIDAAGRDGTVVMPSQTTANSDPEYWRAPPVPRDWWQTIRENMPAYDKARSPSRGMGRIAECFRTWPGTLRSDHPHVSFTARGRNAELITAEHVLTPFFGMDTPLGAMYRLGGQILLMGVGYGNCTALHLAEVLSGTAKMVLNGCAMTENGRRVWKWFDDYDYDADDFSAIGAEYEKIGAVRIGSIGNAVCRLFDLRPAVDFAREWMERNR